MNDQTYLMLYFFYKFALVFLRPKSPNFAFYDDSLCIYHSLSISTLVGLRLLGEVELTDAQTAGALSHNRSNIDIYSNSWGPPDIGTITGGPEMLTRRAFQEGSAMVRGTCSEVFLRLSVCTGLCKHTDLSGY